MTNMWWPYLAWFLGIYGGYPAGHFHPPWYLLMGTTDWYPNAAATTLPSHCLGANTSINGSLHASFSAMWTSLETVIRKLSGSMYLACAASGESGLPKCLQLSSSNPQNTCTRQSDPKFPSCSLMFSNPDCTASTPRFCGAFIPKNVFRNNE